MCAGQCDFFKFFNTHTSGGCVCMGVWMCGVDARSLCLGIVKNVVLDSSFTNE